MTYTVPFHLRPYVDDTDLPPAPDPDPFASSCGWDEVTHVDDLRPVVIVVTGVPYGPTLGRMCATHYRAVLESRAIVRGPVERDAERRGERVR